MTLVRFSVFEPDIVTPLDVVKVRIQTQTMSHGVAVATYAEPIKIYQVPYNLYRNSLRKGYSSRSFIFCSQLFDHVEPLLASPFPESQSPHRFKGTFVSFWSFFVPIIYFNIRMG